MQIVRCLGFLFVSRLEVSSYAFEQKNTISPKYKYALLLII